MSVLKEFLLTEAQFVTRVIPDEQPLIAAALREMAADGACLICTTGTLPGGLGVAYTRGGGAALCQFAYSFDSTGGTGPALRDVTPEAMEEVCDKIMPGFGEVST